MFSQAGHGSWGHVARKNQGGMQVEAALTPLPAQGLVPVGRSNPGSPKARKIQDVLTRFRGVSCVSQHPSPARWPC
jgi:hypothetical protein